MVAGFYFKMCRVLSANGCFLCRKGLPEQSKRRVQAQQEAVFA